MKQTALNNYERQRVIDQLTEFGFSKEVVDSNKWTVFALTDDRGAEYAHQVVFDDTVPYEEFYQVQGQRSFLVDVWDNPADLVFEDYGNIIKAIN